MMRAWMLGVLVWGLSADAAAQPPKLEACPTTDLGRPKASQVAGCASAACVAVGTETSVCKCLEEGGAARFLLREGATTRVGWAAASFVGDVEDFEVRRGAVGPGGSERLIVANRDAESNGIGFTTWTVSLAQLGAFDRPTSFVVQDFGPSVFVRAAGKACGVIETKWESSFDAAKKVGTYFVGRLREWDASAALVPVNGAAALRRRLLGSFEKERLRLFANRGGSKSEWPLVAFTNKSADAVPDDAKHFPDSH